MDCVLADPCGRLHRSFGVAVSEPSLNCHTSIINREGILGLRVSHNFIDHDLKALRKIVGVDRVHTTDHAANKEDPSNVTATCLEV